MWARIDNGAVAELTDIDPAGRFHLSLQWEMADATVQIGDLYDGQAYSRPVEPIEELATRQRAKIDAALAAALAAGMPYTMPDGTDDVVQTRPEDEPNLLGLAIEARDLRDAGVTDAGQVLRAQSNKLYAMTPPQMIAVTDAAKAFKKQQLAHSWARKDEIKAALEASDRAALEAIDW
ncbi:MAG: DUF4376 domain-containing protein [Gammaproteobacteria bacterium]|nr:DUF4376 domain-containing protein [Gammaproteobacteria bacterium]